MKQKLTSSYLTGLELKEWERVAEMLADAYKTIGDETKSPRDNLDSIWHYVRMTKYKHEIEAFKYITGLEIYLKLEAMWLPLIDLYE